MSFNLSPGISLTREMMPEERVQKFHTDDITYTVVKVSSINQRHYPDMGSDASTVRNFCGCFLKYNSTGKPMVA